VTLLALAATAEATGQPSQDRPYRIGKDGTVDWATYSGYRRINAYCESCHGFDGAGSAFAPSLVDSVKRLPHDAFVALIATGKQEVSTARTVKMPGYAGNPNVMCYVDDIYAYLKARADGALGRGRPPGHEPKPPSAAKAESTCLGQ